MYSPGVETTTSSLDILVPQVQPDVRVRFTPALRTQPAPGWEEPACLLCGGQRRKIVVRAYDNAATDDWHRYTVVECLDCGLRFTSPRPLPDLIGEFYPDGYDPHELPARRRQRSWRAWLAGQLGSSRHFRKALPWRGRGRLLD